MLHGDDGKALSFAQSRYAIIIGLANKHTQQDEQGLFKETPYRREMKVRKKARSRREHGDYCILGVHIEGLLAERGAALPGPRHLRRICAASGQQPEQERSIADRTKLFR